LGAGGGGGGVRAWPSKHLASEGTDAGGLLRNQTANI